MALTDERRPSAAAPVRPLAQRRREAVAHTIERVAMQLFADRPMAEVTVEEIATTAGVALRTLYRYYPTKEEIFAAYPRREAKKLADRIGAQPATETPFEALRSAVAETSGDSGREELDRWMAALIKCHTRERIARVALVVMASGLTDALAERAGAAPDDLWPAMAGAMAAAAIDVGTRQWFAQQGNLVEHQLAALDIAGRGLDAA